MILKLIFDLVKVFFGAIFDGIVTIIKWLGALYRAVDSWGFFLIGFVLYVISYVVSSVVWLTPHLPEILNVLVSGTAVQGGVQIPAPLSQGMAFMNSFVPLAEAAQVLVLGITLLGLTTIFRIIKSWVPTVN